MRVGLLLNFNNRLSDFSEKYREILEKNNIPFSLIDPNSETLFSDLKHCDYLIFRHWLGESDRLIYETIFHLAHNIYKVKCFPNYETFWPHDDKIKEFYLLKSHDFPVIDSRVFWDFDNAMAYISQADFPFVMKLPKGAASVNVVLVRKYGEAKKIIKQVFKGGVRSGRLKSKSSLSTFANAGPIKFGRSLLRSQLQKVGIIAYGPEERQVHNSSILIQKFLPDNTTDTRITIIGKRAFGARRFVRQGDFRASGSGSYDFNPDNVDKRCVEIAFSVSQRMNFDSMAYDFLYDIDDKPYISEMSYTFPVEAITDISGYWDEKFCWHERKYLPQYYQLLAFLPVDDLKPTEDD